MIKCNDLYNLSQFGLIVVGIAISTVTSFAYPANPSPAPTNTDVVAALATADKSLSQGIIIYSRKSTGKMPTLYDGKIIYLSDSRFEEDLNFTGQGTSLVSYWDGVNAISQTKMTSIPGNSIAINSTKPADLMPGNYMNTICPGASFALGRGLSLLTDLHMVSDTGDTVTVIGSSDNVATVTADLDPHNNFVARRIEVNFRETQTNKNLTAIWTFGPPMRAASGQIIASSGTYDIPALDVNTHYTIRRANFTRPSLSIPTSIPAGYHVADMRAGPDIPLFLVHTRTLDQILAVTRQRADQLSAEYAQSRAEEKANQRRGTVSFLLIIILVATVIASLSRVRRFRRPPPGAA